jgi:hypothetical protein
MTPQQFYRQEGLNYDEQWKNDKDDRDWGQGDFRTRELNKVWTKLGYVRYEPKTLYEWLNDTRRVFKQAEADLTTKEQKDFLNVCQKSREAGIILETFQGSPSSAIDAPEISRIAYAGPFFSKEGRRDTQFMVQILYCKAFDNYVAAGEEYLKVLAKTSEKAQAEAEIALYRARGKQYEIDHLQGVINATGKLPVSPPSRGIIAYIYLYQRNPDICTVQGRVRGDVIPWKKFIKDMTDPKGKEWNKRTGGRLKLLMDIGPDLGFDLSKMISRKEFSFIYSQSEQAWKDLLSPSEDFLKNSANYESWSKLVASPSNKIGEAPSEELLAKYKALQNGPQISTYWEREPETDGPPLVLWICGVPNQCYWAHVGTVFLSYHLPNSFLKGLCPEWKREFADFEKKLLEEGATPEFIRAWHNSNGYRDKNRPEADKKYWHELNVEEDALYDKYFAKERLKWHRISAEEYAKGMAEQKEWLKSNPKTDSWAYKQNLCANFQRVAPSFDDCCTTDGNVAPKFTLEALEQAQEVRTTSTRP